MSGRELKPKVLEKRWNHKREAQLLEAWEREGVYRFNRNSEKPFFSIDTPPPYASGRWHVGGATHYAQIDMVARYKRMKGYEVLFAFGIDRNGLPVEVEVEKKHNIAAHELPREKFIQLCREFLDEVERDLLSTAKRLGLSCNFEEVYRTDSPEYRSLTQQTFIELWNRQLIYEDNRPTNWCPICHTTIADAELEYRSMETALCYIRFKVKEGGEVVVATTRPELICSCSTVIYHPEDERYRHLAEKHAITPIYEVEIPIQASNYAKPEMGTGVAMICSFGDYTDIRLYREMNLKPQIAITQEGRMNELAGPYRGLTVADAREQIIADLDKATLLVKKETIHHSTPVCWRTKNPVEFISMSEYYLKQLPFIANVRMMAEEMKFHPPEARQLLLNWVNSVNVDWPISRRRYYGTEIPLWFCTHCKKPNVPPPGRYYQPWREESPFEKCKCGSCEFIGEHRTFDTWIDSSISQLYIIGYLQDEDFFKRMFPCSMRPQGTDIVRTWLYYSVLRTFQLLNDKAFRHVRISGMGLDEAGEAMHKSKGNIIWPEHILDKYGTDAFRLWGASEAKLGSNYRFSQERLEGCFRFITKIWNVARFISSFPYPKGNYELAALDRIILAELNVLIEECARGYEETDFFISAQAVRSFLWTIFADHYVEAVKARAYNIDGIFTEQQQNGAWMVLHTCLRVVLRLLAPICPFVTDVLWREIYTGASVHAKGFPNPKAEWESKLRSITTTFIELNSAIWRYKKRLNLALNQTVKTVYAPEKLKLLEADLKAMHKIEELHFGTPDEAVAKHLEKIDEIYITL